MNYSEPEIVLIRKRQRRFTEVLKKSGLHGALISTPENVQYLAGHRPARHRPSVLWIDADGATTLARGDGDDSLATVDECRAYVSDRAGTLVDHAAGEAIGALQLRLPRAGMIGIDAFAFAQESACEQVNVTHNLISLRRTKDALEVRLLKESIAGVQAIYTHIRELLRAGMTELEVCAECHAVAVKCAGGPIGWLGNDFQSGSGGGQPRDRAVKNGELMPLDIGLGANGYIADMCRTLCIGNDPAPAQQRAHRRVMDVFDLILPQLRPGASCAELHQQAIDHLHGFESLTFEHHLGHGIGLNAHEQPRVNKNWNDTLAAGDVITLEPGLYGKSINGGLRLEDVFLITETGFEKISSSSLDLVPAHS